MSFKFDKRWHYLPSDLVFKIITEFRPSTYWNRKFNDVMKELKYQKNHIDYTCSLCSKYYSGKLILHTNEKVGRNDLFYYIDDKKEENNVNHIDFNGNISSFLLMQNEEWGIICNSCIPRWYGFDDPHFYEMTWDNEDEVNDIWNHVIPNTNSYNSHHNQMDIDEYINDLENGSDTLLDEFEEDYDL